jgi:hypothetical protein
MFHLMKIFLAIAPRIGLIDRVEGVGFLSQGENRFDEGRQCPENPKMGAEGGRKRSDSRRDGYILGSAFALRREFWYKQKDRGQSLCV